MIAIVICIAVGGILGIVLFVRLILGDDEDLDE